jgi:hypothetical protein
MYLTPPDDGEGGNPPRNAKSVADMSNVTANVIIKNFNTDYNAFDKEANVRMVGIAKQVLHKMAT